MGKQQTAVYKTWAEKWAELAALCSQSSIVLDRTNYQQVSDLQDAIVGGPWLDTLQAFKALDAHQQEKFIFIAGVVLDSNNFIAMMKVTVLASILDEKDAAIKRLVAEKAQLQQVCNTQVGRINQLKEALENISNDAFKALQ